MKEELYKEYWESIPIGKENAIDYFDLMAKWDTNDREIRKILQDLGAYDNGDEYILIRSAKKGGGFYRTQNIEDMQAYRKECLHKGKSIFAPVRKINRVLNDAFSDRIFEIMKEEG